MLFFDSSQMGCFFRDKCHTDAIVRSLLPFFVRQWPETVSFPTKQTYLTQVFLPFTMYRPLDSDFKGASMAAGRMRRPSNV